MKSRFLQVLLAVFVVLAISQALSAPSSMGVGQKASAGPPFTPTPTPIETPSPLKVAPDTSVPATKSTADGKAQSFIQSVGPGAMRSGFETTDLNPNDDGSTGLVNIGFPINFFGATYTQLYVNNNGNVTFSGPMGTFTPFNIVTTGTVIIAPFFADVDTRSAGQPTRYGTGTVNERPAFGATWRDVDYYQSSASHTNRNHFQLLLIERSDVGAGDFDIEFNYDQIQWEAGTASGSGSNGLGGSSARAGYSNGSAAAFELPGSGVNGAFLDSNPATGLSQHSFNDGQMGRYVYQVRGGLTAAALTTDTVNLNTDTSVNATVTLQNVPAVGLGSYSMVVHFNPAVVTVESVGDGDAPFGSPITKIIDNTAGTVTLAASQSGATPSGTIVLARLNLRGIGNGASPLGITGNTLTDAAGAAMGHVVTPGVATVNTPVIAAGSGSVVVVGSAISIPVSVLGLVSQSLAAYNITISFDKTKITVNSVTGGPAPFGSPTSTIDNTAGTVALSQTVAGGFPTGNVTLASLNVQGVAVGASNFSIAVTTLTNSASAAITNTTVPGVVNVTPPPGQLHHIVVSPASPSLVVGGSETFTAQGYDAYDDPVAGLTFAWSLTGAAAGSINATTGVFTAGTEAGSYSNVIVATSGAITGNASVIVTPGPLHHTVVSPASPSLTVGGAQTFTAATFDQYNNARSGDTIVWSVGNATAGAINASTGAFTAGTVAGSYPNVVVATSGTVSGTASVTVIAGVRLPGDVNNDGVVDVLDLVAVAAAFGSVPTSPNRNADADLNQDGIVNILDLVVVGLNFGSHL
ncbi:MAG: nidogen-like domain-containing protein [Dehalococcoidia bacterium]|nr:nidogen-like domain-containing protein [Dehalococcoidia bacterium]